jgi:hypothetical protein
MVADGLAATPHQRRVELLFVGTLRSWLLKRPWDIVISERLAELELFDRRMVDRELKMIELKKETQELKNQLPTKSQ